MPPVQPARSMRGPYSVVWPRAVLCPCACHLVCQAGRRTGHPCLSHAPLLHDQAKRMPHVSCCQGKEGAPFLQRILPKEPGYRGPDQGCCGEAPPLVCCLVPRPIICPAPLCIMMLLYPPPHKLHIVAHQWQREQEDRRHWPKRRGCWWQLCLQSSSRGCSRGMEVRVCLRGLPGRGRPRLCTKERPGSSQQPFSMYSLCISTL